MKGSATLEKCSRLTDKEIFDSEKITIEDNPLRLLIGNKLSIKTKDGQLIKLRFNAPQQKLFNKIAELRRQRIPVRIVILKCRQTGVCLVPETKILTSDLKWIEIDNISIGQQILAVDENVSGNGRGKGRKMKLGIVENKRDIINEAFKITMEDGRIIVATGEHRFLSKIRSGTETQWRKVKDMKQDDVIRHITSSWGLSNYEDGWFGGIIDGEGSIRRTQRSGYNLEITQQPGVVCDRIREYLFNNKYKFQEKIDKRPAKEGGKFSSRPITMFYLSRMDELMRLIGKTRPSRLINKLWWQNKGLPCRSRGNEAWIRIINIEVIGRKRMIDLQTSTKTFIAEGLVSHNSTESEALIYAFTSQQPNRNSLIMADEEDKANYLFEISKLFQEQLEINDPHLAPLLKKSNEKKLEWEGLHSQILIEPSRNVDATRAYTYQYAHLSEGAYFRDLAGVLEGLQGIPDHWDTMLIIESTANGYGDEFHKLWESASKGKTAWIALFLAWYEMPEYALNLSAGELYPFEGMEFDSEGGMNDFLAEEENLRITYQLSLEQLNWRRWAIINKCNKKVKIFRREYPSNPDEAFLFTGGCVFDTQKLKRQKEKNVKPLALGNLVELDNKIVFRQNPNGKFRIFEWFTPITKIVIGADAAEGIQQDASAAIVLDRATGDTLMSYHSLTTDTDQFAIDLMKMGKFCNNALVGIESYPSAHGYAVVHDLNKIYGNVFKMVIEDKVTKKQTEKLGWYATQKNIQQALDQFIEEVREDATELRDEILIGECLSYVQNPETGDIGAIEGRHDDMVRARIIAGKLRQLYPASMKYAAHPSGDYGQGRPEPQKHESLATWNG